MHAVFLHGTALSKVRMVLKCTKTEITGLNFCARNAALCDKVVLCHTVIAEPMRTSRHKKLRLMLVRETTALDGILVLIRL